VIGPPGLPKPWRRSVAAALPAATGWRRDAWKWAVGSYLAGVLAHFGHHMAFALPQGGNPSLTEALTVAPVSLAWPADLVGTLMQLG
jgi:hypothetical protein